MKKKSGYCGLSRACAVDEMILLLPPFTFYFFSLSFF
jgi:hypothetical protein